jgi:sterol 3beta-glucosyltransferase
MRIAVLTFGSRGDVQPFVALTRGLVQAGHDAFLCAPSNFAAVAAEYDVPFRAQPFDSRELSERPEVKLAMEGGNPLRILLLKGRSYILDVVNWDAWLATRDVDAMVFKVGMPSAAYCISRKRRIPGIEVSYMPLEPSAEFPSFASSLGSGNRMLNRLTGEISYRIFWGLHNPSANLLRSVYLDLPKLSRTDRRPEYRRVGQPTLYVFSPSILPRPADWREEACVVGYQYLNRSLCSWGSAACRA